MSDSWVTMTMVIFTASAIVRERERGNLEMLITTPVKSAELMIGKIAPNLIIATGHNNLAMSRGVLQVAQRFVLGDCLAEGMLNRVEAAIRAYDPCLSCSTHAIGAMPMVIEMVDPDGGVMDQISR